MITKKQWEARRADELGRMLAGSALSEAVMASARELLARGASRADLGNEENAKVRPLRRSSTRKPRVS